MLPIPSWPHYSRCTSHPFYGFRAAGARSRVLLCLQCRLMTAMSSEAPNTRKLSEYLKHAKGQTRTAIRNGQVWEDSLKRLRQKMTLTNATGTENPLALRWREGVVSSQEKAEATKSCVPYEEPSPWRSTPVSPFLELQSKEELRGQLGKCSFCFCRERNLKVQQGHTVNSK